jgi:hypothetical protein
MLKFKDYLDTYLAEKKELIEETAGTQGWVNKSRKIDLEKYLKSHEVSQEVRNRINLALSKLKNPEDRLVDIKDDVNVKGASNQMPKASKKGKEFRAVKDGSGNSPDHFLHITQ